MVAKLIRSLLCACFLFFFQTLYLYMYFIKIIYYRLSADFLNGAVPRVSLHFNRPPYNGVLILHKKMRYVAYRHLVRLDSRLTVCNVG